MNAGWQIGIICKISSGAGYNMFKIRGCATVLWYSLENSHMDFYSPALNFINHCDGLENRWKQGGLSQSYGGWRWLEIWKKSGFGILGVEELSKNGWKNVNYRKAYLSAIPDLLFCFHPSCLKLYRRTSLICHMIWRVEACNIIKCLRIGM